MSVCCRSPYESFRYLAPKRKAISHPSEEAVRFPKPHPESLQRVIQHLGVGSDSMVFVGDSPLDVEAAHAAGVSCLCVRTGYSASSELLKCKPAGVFEDLEAVTARILES